MRKTKAACTNCKKAHVKCGDQRPCIRCIENKIGESCKDSTKRILYDLGSSSISFHPSPATISAQPCKTKPIISNSLSPPKKQRQQLHNLPHQIPLIQPQVQHIHIPQETQQIQHTESQVQEIPQIQHNQQIQIPNSFLEDLLDESPDWVQDAPILIENLEDIILLEPTVDDSILEHSIPSPPYPPSSCSSPSSSSSSSSPHSPASDSFYHSSPTTYYPSFSNSSPVDPSSPSYSSFLADYSPPADCSSSQFSTPYSSSPPQSPPLSLALSSDHEPNLLDALSSVVTMEMQEAELRWKNANNMRNILNRMRLGVEYPQVEVIITGLAELSIVSCNKSFAKMLSMPLDLLQNNHPQIISLMPVSHPRKSRWTMPSVITLQKGFKGADGTIKYCAVTICQKGHYSHSVVVSHESISEGHAVPASLKDIPIFGIQTITS